MPFFPNGLGFQMKGPKGTSCSIRNFQPLNMMVRLNTLDFIVQPSLNTVSNFSKRSPYSTLHDSVSYYCPILCRFMLYVADWLNTALQDIHRALRVLRCHWVMSWKSTRSPGIYINTKRRLQHNPRCPLRSATLHVPIVLIACEIWELASQYKALTTTEASWDC